MSVIRVLNMTATGKSGYIFTGTALKKNLVRSVDEVYPHINWMVLDVTALKLIVNL